MNNPPSLPQGLVVMGALRVQLLDGKTLEDLKNAIDSVVVSPSLMNLNEIRTASYGDLKKEIWVYVGSFDCYDLVPYELATMYGSRFGAKGLGDDDVEALITQGVCTGAHIAYRANLDVPPATASVEGAAALASDLGFRVSGAGVHIAFSVSVDPSATRNEAWLHFRVPDDLTFKGIE